LETFTAAEVRGVTGFELSIFLVGDSTETRSALRRSGKAAVDLAELNSSTVVRAIEYTLRKDTYGPQPVSAN